MTPNNHLLSTYTDLIEKRLNLLVPERDDLSGVLFEASRYALLGEGKRIRPILTLAVAKMFGAEIDRALDAACAIEMVHTYSMIHDDLPCMDDDDFRRGNPSLHRQYNEAVAVLAGDFLLTRAFEVVAKAKHLDTNTRVELILAMTKASGGDGMVGGQVIDLLFENTPIDIETLETLHHKKTGNLIVCAVRCGSIVAKANASERLLIENFARDIGLAFQVIDDVLDVTPGKKKRGTQIPSDLAKSKSTYVTLLGIEQAQKAADQLVKNALASLETLPYEVNVLQSLAHFILKRDH